MRCMHLKPGLEGRGEGAWREAQWKTWLYLARKTQGRFFNAREPALTSDRDTVTQRGCQGAYTQLRHPKAHAEHTRAGPLPGPHAKSLPGVPGPTPSRATQTGTQQHRQHTHWQGQSVCVALSTGFQEAPAGEATHMSRLGEGEHEPAELGAAGLEAHRDVGWGGSFQSAHRSLPIHCS